LRRLIPPILALTLAAACAAAVSALAATPHTIPNVVTRVAAATDARPIVVLTETGLGPNVVETIAHRTKLNATAVTVTQRGVLESIAIHHGPRVVSYLRQKSGCFAVVLRATIALRLPAEIVLPFGATDPTYKVSNTHVNWTVNGDHVTGTDTIGSTGLLATATIRERTYHLPWRYAFSYPAHLPAESAALLDHHPRLCHRNS
jgi:hypothetical protein